MYEQKNLRGMMIGIFRLLLILMFCVCPVRGGEESADEIQNKESVQIIDRYVAIDNVAAWPNLTLLSDGSIIATIFNQPSHGRVEGNVECWISRDEGQNWEYQGTPTLHDPCTNRMNHAVGLAHNGDLIVLVSGWQNPADLTRVLPAWVCRSSDQGKTWQVDKDAVTLPAELATAVPHGDIVRVGEKRLAVGFYGTPTHEDRRDMRGYIFFSQDDGRHWGEQQAMIKTNANETFVWKDTDTPWLAACRNNKPNNITLMSSEEGLSWERVIDLTEPGQHPAQLTRLHDGRLLLSCGNRKRAPERSGIMIRVCEDIPAKWGPSQPLLVLEGSNWDCGYPSTVQLENGLLVTAYYAKQVRCHQRYHMGIVRWRLKPTEQ